MDWWGIAIAIVAGIVAVWLALLVALWAASRKGDHVTLREAMRLLPDVVRLLRRLASDSTLPRGVRVRLVLLLGYLLLPIDLVPDFIPVIGYLDDAVIVALALRSVVRVAGPDVRTGNGPSAVDPGHSHSMVPGGLLVTSSTTRFTSRTSLVIRVEILASTS